MALKHTAVLLLAVVGLACTEKKELPAVEMPPPPFNYGLYCNEQGRLKEPDLALWLARRPEHLECVYADARQGLPRAKALVRDVEKVVASVGRQVAQAATSAPCLVAPTPCHLDEEFLDKAVVGSDGREAKRLKAVLVSAYARRQYEREKELKVTFSLATEVLAGGLIENLPQKLKDLKRKTGGLLAEPVWQGAGGAHWPRAGTVHTGLAPGGTAPRLRALPQPPHARGL